MAPSDRLSSRVPSQHAASHEAASRRSASSTSLLEILAGPGGLVALLIVGVLILREEPWTFSAKDFLYWMIVAGMLLASTAYARKLPSALEELRRRSRRHAWTIVLGAGVAWAVVHSFGV